MAEHVDVVVAVKARLLAQGEDLSGPCGAFKITSRVALALREIEQDAAGQPVWGLIHSGGNGCETHGDKFRADTIMKHDGSVVDILNRSESNNGDTSDPSAYNIPTWSPTGPQDPGNWRAPFDPGDSPVPIPPVPGPGGCGCASELAALQQQIDTLKTENEGVRNELAVVKKTIPKGVQSSASIYGLRIPVNSSLTY